MAAAAAAGMDELAVAGLAGLVGLVGLVLVERRESAHAMLLHRCHSRARYFLASSSLAIWTTLGMPQRSQATVWGRW